MLYNYIHSTLRVPTYNFPIYVRIYNTEHIIKTCLVTILPVSITSIKSLIQVNL